MSTTLPRPNVSAETKTEDYKTHVDVVISRDGKAKSYKGEGSTEAARTKHVVDQVINDGHTAEWLP
jgi:hypothetical protein